jgi:HK97 family phage prohead protease
MNKLFNLTSTFKAAEADDGSVMIRGMASTADFDRAGDSISAEAWTKGGLANFEKNPIILFNHDYDKPIGRATGLKAGPNGLELECKISKAAPANVAQLVKDGVLGAFSVGFRVKDADYLKETDGLMIKDAELFEVSVVSVPCNQSATFSLAKSFDSDEEYNEFKKTFTNRVDLAGQSLAKDEDTSSNIASDHTPKSADDISADQEIKMDNKDIDLEAFAKQVAEDTAAKIAMKQAEQKAAEEAQAKAAQEASEAKALEAESIKSVVNSGVESGVEKLMADVEAKMSEKDASLTEVMETFRSELEEKKAEIKAMQESKKSFSDRSEKADLSKFGKDFLNARILGAITGKGYDTDFGRSIMEKTGAVAENVGSLNTVVSQQFIDEVGYAQQLGGLFPELAVTSAKTTLPITRTPKEATFGTGGLTDTNQLVNAGDTAASGQGYDVEDVTVSAFRLIAGTYVLNDTDEQLVVSLLPQITKQLAKAHASAVDKSILYGAAGYSSHGLVGTAGAQNSGSAIAADGGSTSTATFDAANNAGNAYPTPVQLAGLRSGMGAYGQDTNDLAIIIAPDAYYSIIHTDGFTDISEVGSDFATKLTGEVGSIFGVKVIVSDRLVSKAASGIAGIMVNTSNFVRPRLGGVNFETEYSVLNQRTNLVASQSVGFNRLVSANASAQRLMYPDNS